MELKWFRGASESAILNTYSKNVVIYGSNGSGKSSFVDALEYVISDGRIEHLAHEYSGKKQEDSIINTHIPEGLNSFINLSFSGNKNINIEIDAEGNKTINSTPKDLVDTIQRWKIENYILRQDEVARFIHLRKGEKYSVLLPLLGLDKLGLVADNFKRLHQRLSKDTKVDIVKNHLDRINGKIKKYYTNNNDPKIFNKLSELCSHHEISYNGNIRTDSHALLLKMNDSIANLMPENTRYKMLNQCRNENLQDKNNSYDASKTELARIATGLIDKKIEVLSAALSYSQEIGLEGEIKCPACGQSIDSKEFHAHIEKELSELEEADKKKKEYENQEKDLTRSFIRVITTLSDEELQKWMIENGHKEMHKKITEIDKKIKRSEPIDYRAEIQEINAFIESHLVSPPAEITELLAQQEMLNNIRLIPGVQYIQAYYDRVKSTINYLEKCETLTQAKIKEKAEEKTQEMTKKLQELWRKIHPDEPIEDVKLYLPADSDKAIDISLKFYGVDQPSPRITLSEGHRNSLGLCIFLSLALSQESDDPIILDDIVSSLDRDHRNRLTHILKDDLARRQVILFTHDRDYYTELRYLLPQKNWEFFVLSPWSDPTTGIQWAKSSYSFDDARALLPTYPESSANRARAIMDSNMSVIAEQLQILVPHLRGTSNDRRTCIEFLERTIPISRTSYKIKENGDYFINTGALKTLEEANRLILAYGNPASHDRQVVPSEVGELISACEAALDAFRCPKCHEYVWMAEIETRKRYQCPCGNLRWQCS